MVWRFLMKLNTWEYAVIVFGLIGGFALSLIILSVVVVSLFDGGRVTITTNRVTGVWEQVMDTVAVTSVIVCTALGFGLVSWKDREDRLEAPRE
jgi:nucleoside recognition membrane protein YjiH